MSLPTMGLAAALAVVALLAGCAQAVRTQTATLTAAADQPAKVLRLERDARVALHTGYERLLKAGSRWRQVGSVAQGQVFRPVDSVLTIEGRQVHEAYLVLSGGKLVGFYLPGESNYAALDVPVPLSIGEPQ